MSYVDPRKPIDSQDPMHEWYFRSSLDRYIWIYGMICAWIHPQFSALLTYIDNLPPIKRTTMRGIMLSICGVVGYFWYTYIYCLPKVSVQKINPDSMIADGLMANPNPNPNPTLLRHRSSITPCTPTRAGSLSHYGSCSGMFCPSKGCGTCDSTAGLAASLSRLTLASSISGSRWVTFSSQS